MRGSREGGRKGRGGKRKREDEVSKGEKKGGGLSLALAG